jgi:hypothetical protein
MTIKYNNSSTNVFGFQVDVEVCVMSRDEDVYKVELTLTCDADEKPSECKFII